MEQTLKTIYLFQGTIELTSALHIGGGNVNTTNTDSPVVRTPDGRPYIPGSSFKGVFRSTVEKLTPHIPTAKTCALQEGKDCFHREDKKAIFTRIKERAKNEAELIAQSLQEICDTCQLFGNGFTASHIFFSDLYSKDWGGVTQIRDGVVIDRDSEKAVDKLKFDFETVPVGTTFNFDIRLENPRLPLDLGLVCLGLNEFLSGMGHFGGNRSRGLGNCTMAIRQAYQTDFSDRAQVKRYLLNTKLEDKMTPIDDVQQFITTAIESICYM